MRPLPEQLLKYAQQDTHFLLYIFDMMTNDLLRAANGKTNLLRTVYMDSKIISRKRYVKPVITEDSHKDLYLKSKRSFDNRQLYALREIFAWRDKIARLEDESYPYVLPNHMLLQICESLPREMQGILACCNPIPPLVRQHLNHLHQIVLKAREQPLIKQIINSNLVRPVLNLNDKKDLLNNPLYCPHDLSHQTDFRDDLPTKINNKNGTKAFDDIEIRNVTLSVFEKRENVLSKSNEVAVQFISPYTRYMLMIPFMEEQRKRELEIEEEKRKEALEQKRQAVPELQVVKISDDGLYQMPLKELKKRPLSIDPNEMSKIPISNKRWKKESQKQETPEASQGKAEAPEEASINIGNDRGGKRKKNQRSGDFRQSSSKPVNFDFDYSNANYQRFQGGSSHQQGQKDKGFQQKFKGGKKNAKLDKMFSFSNFRLNKKRN